MNWKKVLSMALIAFLWLGVLVAGSEATLWWSGSMDKLIYFIGLCILIAFVGILIAVIENKLKEDQE